MRRKCYGFLSPGTKQTVRINAVSLNERGLTVKAKEKTKISSWKGRICFKEGLESWLGSNWKTSVTTTNIEIRFQCQRCRQRVDNSPTVHWSSPCFTSALASLRSRRFLCGLGTKNESQRPREKWSDKKSGEFLTLVPYLRDQNQKSRSTSFLDLSLLLYHDGNACYAYYRCPELYGS